MDSLLRFNRHHLPENFVSVAVQIAGLKPTHAAILIRYKTINYLHHFPGLIPPRIEENFNEDGWTIYKILTSFDVDDPDEIGAFLQYCRRICSKSKITYGYIADGSHYTAEGEFASASGLPELGTCVGFCINTLNNSILDVEGSILNFDDWDNSGITDQSIDSRSQDRVRRLYPELDWALFNAFHKRIPPIDYLCSSFFNDFPIRKAEIDGIRTTVMNRIRALIA
jgi:hypothetical protein